MLDTYQTRNRELYLDCMVSLGMFSSERGVRVEIPNGQSVFALVDRSQVRAQEDPRPGGEVPGHVLVSLISLEDGYAFVDLPQPAIAGGQRIRVPKDRLTAKAS